MIGLVRLFQRAFATFLSLQFAFTTQIAPENGTSYWGYMTTLASLSVAIVPILGGIADARSVEKINAIYFYTYRRFKYYIIMEYSFLKRVYIMQALIICFISIFAMELTFVFIIHFYPL